MLGSPQEIGIFSVGGMGGIMTTGTGVFSGNFGAVKFMTDASGIFFGTNVQNMDGYTGSFLQGDVYLFSFTSGRLLTGSAIFYKG